MQIMNIRLDPQTDRKLAALAKRIGAQKEAIVVQAILDFVEDREDYFGGIVIRDKNEPNMTLSEMGRRLRL